MVSDEELENILKNVPQKEGIVQDTEAIKKMQEGLAEKHRDYGFDMIFSNHMSSDDTSETIMMTVTPSGSIRNMGYSTTTQRISPARDLDAIARYLAEHEEPDRINHLMIGKNTLYASGEYLPIVDILNLFENMQQKKD